MEKQTRIGAPEIDEAIGRIIAQILELEPDPQQLMVGGIANGGVLLGQMLAERLSAAYGTTIPFGQLNITFHRDDLGQNPIPAEKYRTDFPVPPNGRTVLLVDDVIFSGRSARAALAELFDLGRPRCVRLIALFDRGGRKLPIQPDVVGFTHSVDASQQVSVALDPANPSTNAITVSPK